MCRLGLGDKVKAEEILSQLPSCCLVFLAKLLVSDVGEGW